MSTHFFHSGMVGAPTNTNAAGSTLAIIDACLNTGFNVVAPLSASVTSEVMTLTYAAAHGYEDKVWIRLDGAPGGSITQRATVTSTAVLTIPAPGFSAGTVIGTLSTRVAPADWERVFSDTGVGVFRSKVVGPGSTRFFYRVQDTSTASLSPGFRGYESMTDANTGINPFPTVAQVAGPGFLSYKSGSSTARPWLLVADERTVYFATTDSTNQAMYPFCFGDILSGKPGDAFGAILTSTNGSTVDRLAAVSATGHYVARSHDQVSKSVMATSYAPLSSASGAAGTYPSDVSGGATFAGPVAVSQVSQLRGFFRGLMHVWEPVPSWPFGIYTDIAGVSGRVLTVMCGSSARIAFPLDEPW